MLGIRRKTVSVTILALLIVSMFTIPLNIQPARAEPGTWIVDDDLQDCPGADFTKIQDAVDAANAGDTIIVYPGIYIIQNTLIVAQDVTLTIEPGVTLKF
ncbi:MAG: hypothetical protein V1850_03775, partial [Candidatus Bathyarchaeota archaeon]